ncbi:DNA/RNA helicase [Burkholderia phage BcepSauron]|uniref:DNA/RNA helicase n=1 Tax=Burkholderia phage BcepSauron TaxID=2530033 RepID=A0A482MN31_9CAUD|nr:DNA/RNA helicase [Burkholderia phage BcepSauron]QBQ74573.1 DNA/RNA helicase [Burkholderia phage BcepSauron]
MMEESKSPLIINYVDAPPGTGKTEAACEFMARHVRTWLNGERGKSRYVFYVASSRQLLRQTYRRLRAGLTPGERFMLRIAYSRDNARANSSTSVMHQIVNILNGFTNDGKQSRAFTPGCVLFMTHAGFLSLQSSPMFRHTTVIFDEARKWAEIVEKIKLDADTQNYMERLFDINPLILDGDEASGISTLVPRDIPENQKVTKLNGKAAARQFAVLDDLHASLSTKDGVARTRAYGLFEGKGSARKMIQISLPSFPFVGFRHVYIMAADFTNSQMYHLLKWEDAILNDVSRQFLNEYTKLGYTASMERIARRYEKLVIVPLLRDSRVPAIRQYDFGFILPKDQITKLGNWMQRTGLNTTDIQRAVGRHRDPEFYGDTKQEDRDIVRYITENAHAHIDIMEWLLDQSESVLRQWRAKHGRENKALLFINESHREKYEYNRKMMRFMSHARAPGINKYMGCNAVVFHAAINPWPQLGRLLQFLLGRPHEDGTPGYDPDEDYVVDRAIQCLGRGNIRDHDSESPMLAIVPTLGLAEKLHHRYNHAPTLMHQAMINRGEYMMWNYNKFKQAQREVVQAEAPKKRVKLELTKDESTLINKLRVKATRAKQKGDAETADTALAQVAEIQALARARAEKESSK